MDASGVRVAKGAKVLEFKGGRVSRWQGLKVLVFKGAKGNKGA